MKRLLAVAAVGLALAACSDRDPVAGPGEQAPAPLLAAAGEQAPGRYIVVFRPGTDVDRTTDELIRGFGGEVHFRYRAALLGFAATLPPQAVEGIRRNPNVEFVEADGIMSISATQSNATWGLDRIDQRDLPLSGTYVYNGTGSGVRAYIIDTGIRSTHNDFGGRVSGGFTAITDNRGTEDCHGHGTHVAGTVGGATWGVAKGVSLIPVRVLNCQGSGTTSGVIAGVDWVTANHVKPAVANMSLGGGASSSLDLAVNNSVGAGVTYAVAAGNSNANACNYSPARVASALTVGATTSTDARASYSNFGSCLDLFAPGSSITSAWSTSNTATNTISGTSMASPHVAGVAALYLQGNSTASPATVANAIVSGATTGKVTSAGSESPNRLLYSLLDGGSTPPPPGPTVEVHLAGTSGSTAWANASRRHWRATVTVTVRNDSDALVAGATVTGNWSAGATGSTSCTTNSSGVCSFTSGNIASSVGSVTWTVGNVSASGASYDSSANDGSPIVVSRPN